MEFRSRTHGIVYFHSERMLVATIRPSCIMEDKRRLGGMQVQFVV